MSDPLNQKCLGKTKDGKKYYGDYIAFPPERISLSFEDIKMAFEVLTRQKKDTEEAAKIKLDKGETILKYDSEKHQFTFGWKASLKT